MSDQDGVMQIFREPGSPPVGMGILIRPDEVITCAHVVNAALGRAETDLKCPERTEYVWVRQAFTNPPGLYRRWHVGTVHRPTWRALSDDRKDELRDFAVLELTSEVKRTKTMEFPSVRQRSPKRPVGGYGHPRVGGRGTPIIEEGTWGGGHFGRLVNNTHHEIHFHSDYPRFFYGGYSGTAIGEHSCGPLGMLQEVDETSPDPLQHRALAKTIDTLSICYDEVYFGGFPLRKTAGDLWHDLWNPVWEGIRAGLAKLLRRG